MLGKYFWQGALSSFAADGTTPARTRPSVVAPCLLTPGSVIQENALLWFFIPPPSRTQLGFTSRRDGPSALLLCELRQRVSRPDASASTTELPAPELTPPRRLCSRQALSCADHRSCAAPVSVARPCHQTGRAPSRSERGIAPLQVPWRPKLRPLPTRRRRPPRPWRSAPTRRSPPRCTSSRSSTGRRRSACCATPSTCGARCPGSTSWTSTRS